MEDFMNIPTVVEEQVLSRVPYRLHDELKGVCRSWNEMMCSRQFYEHRKYYGTTQHFICLFHSISSLFDYGITVYDPVEKTWERTAPIPYDRPPSMERRTAPIHFVSVNGKLVLFGEQSVNEIENWPTRLKVVVFIYDFVSKEWRRGADMSTGRISFACAVSSLKGLIYVAGGRDEHGNSLATAEAYDVEEDRWEVLPPMTQNHTSDVGVYLEGKFMVITERFDGGVFESSAEVFDEETGSWHTLENMWILPRSITGRCYFVCTRGTLYVILSKEVMKYDALKNVWTPVTSVPGVINWVFSAAAWRDQIFVNGLPEKGNAISYFFQPSTGKWSAVEHDEFASTAYAVTSLEI